MNVTPMRRREDEAAQGLKRLWFFVQLCSAVAAVYVAAVFLMSWS